MALRAYTWNKSTGGTGNWNVAGNWTGVGSGYPGDGGGDDRCAAAAALSWLVRQHPRSLALLLWRGQAG